MTENRTRIKICGLTRPEDIEAVNEAGPDYCGFIINVPKSRRNVTPEQVRELCRRLSGEICPVGVFVNAEAELIAGLLEEGVIRVAQLHGQEGEDEIRRLREMTGGEIWKAFSIHDREDLLRAAKSSADRILLDHGKGGTGEQFDWSLLEEMNRLGRQYILAGGLGIHNISHAIRTYRPWCIDLSSSVETDGKKDRDKIQAAADAVRREDECR